MTRKYFGDYPKAWVQMKIDEPEKWAQYVHEMDQMLADANHDLDGLIDALVQDMGDRPESLQHSDAEPFAAMVFGMKAAIEASGGITYALLACYNAALYRLARQRISQ